MDRLNWSKLKTFYRVASCGSYARAAEKYHITPTALSKMVKSLESELNCKLLTRTDTGIKLTSEGQILFKDVNRMSNMLNISEAALLNTTQKIVGHLKLVSPAGISSMYVSRFIDYFLNTHPEIYLEIISYDDMPLNEKLSGHILIHPFIENIVGYSQEHLIKFNLKLFASKEYLSKFGTPTTVDDLNHHRLIGFTRGKHLFVDLNWHLKVGMLPGNERTAVFEANASFGRCYLASKGVGIISVPKQHPDLEKYDLVEILPDLKGPEFSYYLIMDEILKNNEKVNILSEFLKNRFSNL
jgi:DNA-binding transcriptional LysR family regulator